MRLKSDLDQPLLGQPNGVAQFWRLPTYLIVRPTPSSGYGYPSTSPVYRHKAH
jgi:hypothetical protein